MTIQKAEEKGPSLGGGVALTLGAVTTVVCMLPVYLTGALAVELTGSLKFGAVGIGGAVAAFRASGAACAPWLGRFVDQWGALRAIKRATIFSLVGSIWIAVFAKGWTSLAVGLVFGGVSVALGQPAANRLLARAVRSDRLGLSFGVKQAAVPTASMLAGLSVPIVALAVNWRWVFAVAAAMSALVLLLSPKPRRSPHGRALTIPGTYEQGVLTERRHTLVILGVAFGCGTSSLSATTTFLVPSGVALGLPYEAVGLYLAMASLVAIAMRVFSGLVADWISRHHLRISGGMLLVGSVGMLMLASVRPGLFALGSLLAIGGGWGFNAVFWYSIVRRFQSYPGQVTGLISPGGFLGSTLGPLLFGTVVQSSGYSASWLIVAALSGAGGSMMVLGSRLLDRPG